MTALSLRSAIRKRKENENPKSPPRRSISPGKNRSANVQYPAEKFLKLTRVTFARIHRRIASLANSSSAKRSSAARFRKNRRKHFYRRGKPIFSKVSSRSVDDLSPPI